jgi:acetyltransferase
LVETQWRCPRRRLDSIFAPRHVAVIGATDRPHSVGRTVLSNLLRNPFGGTVYPVNPKRRSVLGVPCWPDVAALPETVDLAVIVTPSATVPAVIKRCVDVGVGAAIVISAGFREGGAAGVELERQVLEQARGGLMRIVGPNCLGVMTPGHGLNATFAAGMAKPGNVAFLSQSGALCTAVLDWSLGESVGFSAFVSTGSMLDVGWGDLIDYFGDDPATKSILVYMESIGDVRSFMSVAREVALAKPIIVIKAGRTDPAARAAASHTGALAGSDDILDAAFRRAGILRVDRISELFDVAEVLARQPRPAGKRLTIVTNAGGPGVLATDALVSGGGELASLSEQTRTSLDQLLPPLWSHNNPVDVLGDASPERYAKAVEIVARDPNTDALLVVLTPQDMTDPGATAEHLCRTAARIDEPVLASWMGAGAVTAGKELLSRASIPTYDFPDSAARAFNYMWRHQANLKMLYETPAIGDGTEEPGASCAVAAGIIDVARASGRAMLTEAEAKDILATYGIPVVRAHPAETAERAVALAEQVGYPVVLKLLSRTITHKSDVGGVALNLTDAAAVRNAFDGIRQRVSRAAGEEHFHGVTVQRMVRKQGYELIVGSSTDNQFGPVITFGLGGQLVEVFKDRALGLPPLNDVLARRMMERTRVYSALRGVRGRAPVDLAQLERLLVRFSQLVLDQRWIKEVEINPLLASADELIGLDARVVLHDATTPEDRLPKPAIRPYPSQYVVAGTLRDRTPVTIRPIRPEDEPLMVQFHRGLSDDNVRLRYFCSMSFAQRTAHERLVRVCLSDYDRQLALVATHRDSETGAGEIMGVGRISRTHGSSDAEFALVVGDRWQGRGLGTRLLREIIRVAEAEGMESLWAEVLPQNTHMRRICASMGFSVSGAGNEEPVDVHLRLRKAMSAEAPPAASVAQPQGKLLAVSAAKH